jgi:hypothetical protein
MWLRPMCQMSCDFGTLALKARHLSREKWPKDRSFASHRLPMPTDRSKWKACGHIPAAKSEASLLSPRRGGDLHVGPAELPSSGLRLMEGGEALQESTQPVHLPTVRIPRRRESFEDGGAGHRLGRAGEKTGDLRQQVTARSAALRAHPVALMQLVLDERHNYDLQGVRAAPASLPRTCEPGAVAVRHGARGGSPGRPRRPHRPAPAAPPIRQRIPRLPPCVPSSTTSPPAPTRSAS